MKVISAKASFSEKAKKLFQSKESSREVYAGVLRVRTNRESTGSFKAGKYVVTTERANSQMPSTLKKEKA